jgi:hypothetical protein
MWQRSAALGSCIMTDLTTLALQKAHYGPIRARLWGARSRKAMPIAPKPELPLAAPPRPRRSLRDAILTLKSPISLSEVHALSWNARLETLVQVVIKVTRVPKIDFVSLRRNREACEARHLFCWLARAYTTASYSNIGRRCGSRDHTTVQHGIKKINANLPAWKARIDACLAEMGE